MSNPTELIEAVRALKPNLSNLIGDQAKVVGPQLDELLAQAEQGQPVDNHIRNLIRPHPAVHAWVVEYLKFQASAADVEPTRGGLYPPAPSAQLPGFVGEILAGKYVCPQCGSPYFLRDEGGEVRDCPIHNISRVFVSNG